MMLDRNIITLYAVVLAIIFMGLDEVSKRIMVQGCGMKATDWLRLAALCLVFSALVVGRLVLAGAMTSRAIGGMALIAAGLAAIDGRLVRRGTSVGA